METRNSEATREEARKASRLRPKSDTLTAPIFSGKDRCGEVCVFGQIGNPHRTYLSKSDGLGYRPSKLKKVSTEMKLEKVSTESPSIVKL